MSLNIPEFETAIGTDVVGSFSCSTRCERARFAVEEFPSSNRRLPTQGLGRRTIPGLAIRGATGRSPVLPKLEPATS